MAPFPLNPKYFVTLDNIHERGDAVIDGGLAGELMQQGYVTLHGTEWATTSKAREFLRMYGKDQQYLSIVRAAWPNELLACVRQFEHNVHPDLSNEALKSLSNTGYISKTDVGTWFLTEKARDLLRRYKD